MNLNWKYNFKNCFFRKEIFYLFLRCLDYITGYNLPFLCFLFSQPPDQCWLSFIIFIDYPCWPNLMHNGNYIIRGGAGARAVAEVGVAAAARIVAGAAVKVKCVLSWSAM